MSTTPSPHDIRMATPIGVKEIPYLSSFEALTDMADFFLSLTVPNRILSITEEHGMYNVAWVERRKLVNTNTPPRGSDVV